MKLDTRLSFACLLVAVILAAVPAVHARSYAPDDGLAVTSVQRAPTPRALVRFCLGNPEECKGGGPAEVTLTPDLRALLGQVNVDINKAIRPLAERRDVWTLNPPAGDCEDYVLSKRSALVAGGVPAGSLRIAFTYTRRGVPHAILIVRTDAGDLVLDNLSNGVKALDASGYRIRSMSGPDPIRWTTG